jgi:hypothetical protein
VTAEEIRESRYNYTSDGRWLKEIAYQLAVMNEREEKKHGIEQVEILGEVDVNNNF